MEDSEMLAKRIETYIAGKKNNILPHSANFYSIRGEKDVIISTLDITLTSGHAQLICKMDKQ